MFVPSDISRECQGYLKVKSSRSGSFFWLNFFSCVVELQCTLKKRQHMNNQPYVVLQSNTVERTAD